MWYSLFSWNMSLWRLTVIDFVQNASIYIIFDAGPGLAAPWAQAHGLWVGTGGGKVSRILGFPAWLWAFGSLALGHEPMGP